MDKERYDFNGLLNLLQEGTYEYLTEESFYPPSDDRVWQSYVEDIEDGDNFADYCEYIFNLLEEEEYYED